MVKDDEQPKLESVLVHQMPVCLGWHIVTIAVIASNISCSRSVSRLKAIQPHAKRDHECVPLTYPL